MAGNGQVVLQVSDYTLAGIDKTIRTLRVKGNALPVIAPGSLASLTLVAGGTGWAANDEFTIPSIPGAIGKVLTESGGAVETMSILVPGSGGTAGTGVATAAISPSTGAGLTVTTTVNAGGILNITGWSITSNVATFNAVNSLTGGGGQVLVVTGFTGAYAYLNGTYTTTAATSTTFTAALTAANASGTQTGNATIQPTYTTGGIPILSGFVDQNGNPRPVAGIGPLATPNWLDVRTKEASVLTYAVNWVASTPLLRIFSSGAELSSGAAITGDFVGFLAEFVFGAF